MHLVLLDLSLKLLFKNFFILYVFQKFEKITISKGGRDSIDFRKKLKTQEFTEISKKTENRKYLQNFTKRSRY